MAAREQDRAKARLHFYPVDYLDFGLDVNYRDNDYTDTAIGLTSSRSTSVTFDGALVVGLHMSFHAFATHERHENDQAGSQNFTIPDWFATKEDVINSFGIGGEYEMPFEGLAFNLEFVRSEATGDIDIRGETGFPDLEDTVTSVEAGARYRVNPDVTTGLSYYYERLETDDWMVKGIEPDTIPSVLTLGSGQVEYDNHMIAAYVRYSF